MPTGFDHPRTVSQVTNDNLRPVTPMQALTAIYRLSHMEDSPYMRTVRSDLAIIYASALVPQQEPFDVEMDSVHELINHGYITAKMHNDDSLDIVLRPFVS
jgi:hypothetical protein